MEDVDEALSTYRAASTANDIDRLMTALAADCEVVSPISGSMVFRGRADVAFLLGNVYSTIRGISWDEEIGAGSARVLIGTFKVGPLQGSDAMAFDLDEDGRIRRIRPHLRPWLATTLFALLLGPKVARRPGVIWRALRAG